MKQPGSRAGIVKTRCSTDRPPDFTAVTLRMSFEESSVTLPVGLTVRPAMDCAFEAMPSTVPMSNPDFERILARTLTRYIWSSERPIFSR
jgi:hypothetical protein